jgi:Clp amino terminal domain, pathogenicity island component
VIGVSLVPLDPVTAEAGSKIALTLLEPVLRPVGEKVRNVVLGAPEQTSADKVIHQAISRAVEDMREQGLNEEMVRHVISMLEYLFMHQNHQGISAFDHSDEAHTIRYWRDAADAAGWDLVTFPLYFPDVVGKILEYLPDLLRDEAGTPGSPLFNRMTTADLAKIRAQLDGAIDFSKQAMTWNIPISAPLLRTMNGALLAAQASDRTFVTPHLLLALLRKRGSLTSEIFESARQGLAAEITQILSHYIAGAHLGRFAEFDWLERRDVQAAQVVAARQGVPVIIEGHLLVAILETPSNTQRQLVEWLGADLTSKTRAIALETKSNAARIGTPGKVFPLT